MGISSKSLLPCVLYGFLLLYPSCNLNDHAVEGAKPYFHTLKINSLPLSEVCNESSKAVKEGLPFLKVVHKYGPCNPHKTSIARPSYTEILHQDKLRVDSIIQARHSMNFARNAEQMKSSVPFNAQSKLSASDYIVDVDLGKPKQKIPLLLDTGSGLIWTQCKPCKPCYPKTPLFDPTKSTSFKGIPCSSKLCQSLQQRCSSSKCAYEYSYFDNSSSTGIYAMETLSLKPLNYEFKNILIGCGDHVSGESFGESGVLGINRDPTSFPSQTANKFNKLFSYCIPSNPASTGYLTFGGEVSKDVKFSPVVSQSTDYDIQMTGIRVGGRELLINASVFKFASTIDTGTVFTRLPPKAYSVLRKMFRQMMKGYPMVDADDLLDTCYDFGNYTTVTIPTISVFFKGGVEVDIDVSGIMDRQSSTTMVYCLAFAAFDDEVAVFGNVQQRTYTVVFDDAKERIGFAPGGCD